MLGFLGAAAAGRSTNGASLVARNDTRFIGASGCQSSYCHGGAGEKRNQYLTWVKQDFHSRAHAVLVNARSALMAQSLGLPAAQTSARCTVCHSPFQAVAASQLANTAQPDEGVSCENCHGAASPWLRGHTRRDWSYATCVGAGMHDLRNFYVRANACVACHQNLEPELLAAGHPELTFELDGQSVAEPKHWQDNDPFSGPRAWLVGQAVALREMSWQLTKNESPDENAVASWSGLTWVLAKATANQTSLQGVDSTGLIANRAAFSTIQRQADTLARQASAIAWSEERTATILQRLAATEAEFVISPNSPANLLFRRAARLSLALDRLSRALQPQGSASSTNALQALYQDVRVQSDFQPAKFAADLATFRATLPGGP